MIGRVVVRRGGCGGLRGGRGRLAQVQVQRADAALGVLVARVVGVLAEEGVWRDGLLLDRAYIGGQWVEADDGSVAVEEGPVVLGGVGEEVGELIRDLDPVHGAGQHVLRAGPRFVVCSFVPRKLDYHPQAVPVRLAELMKEAGLPDGILNVVHGDKEMVDAILDHDDIKAISFVGSSDIAHYIYSRGTANGKRVQAFGGAKNHGIVMPDADLDQVVNDLAGAAFGSAGERCMALPVVVPVGDKTADALREKLIPAIEGLRVGVSTDPEAHYGPVVNAAHKERIENYIQMCIDEGGELVVDGRGFTLQGHEQGYFIGPTFFDHVKPSFQSYQEEIFGPVLQMVRAASFDEAVRLPSEHQYGNGVAIFTRNGHAAREFAARVNVGMVGVNVPIPVPVAYHTFGGWKRSGFGDINQHGMEGVRFWTKVKTVTQRWPDDFVEALSTEAFHIPTMG